MNEHESKFVKGDIVRMEGSPDLLVTGTYRDAVYCTWYDWLRKADRTELIMGTALTHVEKRDQA